MIKRCTESLTSCSGVLHSGRSSTAATTTLPSSSSLDEAPEAPGPAYIMVGNACLLRIAHSCNSRWPAELFVLQVAAQGASALGRPGSVVAMERCPVLEAF